MSFEAALEVVAKAAAINAIERKNDYVKDGLLICGNCNTPRQTRVNILGTERTVYCICECQIAKMEREKEERREIEAMQRIRELKTQGIQDKEIRNWTFANDNGLDPQRMDKAARYYSKWGQMYRDNIGLLLWGNVGTGKTYFAACIANALLENSVPVLMTNFSKIINALQGFSIQDKNEYLSQLSRYKLLIIDDLGAERQSEFAQEIVYNVIDTRYKNGQPLIVTTNLTLDQIKNPKDLDCSRIYDRVLEMCTPIHFKGESLRRGKYQEKMDRAKDLFGDGT